MRNATCTVKFIVRDKQARMHRFIVDIGASGHASADKSMLKIHSDTRYVLLLIETILLI
jgi:hypothetical protein